MVRPATRRGAAVHATQVPAAVTQAAHHGMSLAHLVDVAPLVRRRLKPELQRRMDDIAVLRAARQLRQLIELGASGAPARSQNSSSPRTSCVIHPEPNLIDHSRRDGSCTLS